MDGDVQWESLRFPRKWRKRLRGLLLVGRKGRLRAHRFGISSRKNYLY